MSVTMIRMKKVNDTVAVVITNTEVSGFTARLQVYKDYGMADRCGSLLYSMPWSDERDAITEFEVYCADPEYLLLVED